jgi:hypothetical protein
MLSGEEESSGDYHILNPERSSLLYWETKKRGTQMKIFSSYVTSA